ncbi:T-complex protein 1 [Metschnikowia bicuspidata var. bicuspidata NRRL YB-4993]|uniref:CCT-theta n=1 Tax=Metschnikowia bicuspidata var. bicuspidata NRRL YB-4993 TaxID=869754 RepID=A0A1A0HAV4_9ASCO|nr:T-complex protein 1 [Metschnikowia bicuspidata var. bicuspidata NRRL YB-4993]OBA21012.1 T-complex protein 1 [Metschnikowia bicuspidata var. bicuspidata NRRL YB-4993]
MAPIIGMTKFPTLWVSTDYKGASRRNTSGFQDRLQKQDLSEVTSSARLITRLPRSYVNPKSQTLYPRQSQSNTPKNLHPKQPTQKKPHLTKKGNPPKHAAKPPPGHGIGHVPPRHVRAKNPPKTARETRALLAPNAQLVFLHPPFSTPHAPKMSLKMPSAPNTGLFKQGYSSYSAADGATVRNIEAVREVSSIVLTSMGPSGRNKILVNKHDRTFVTNDAATIVNELDIVHPAVKMLVMASKQQEFEMGDNTNLVLILAGELLDISERLLVAGLSVPEIVQGFNLANTHVQATMPDLVVARVENVVDEAELTKAIRPVIAAKQYGVDAAIAALVVAAVRLILDPKRPQAFNIDNVRVVKIMGSSLRGLEVVKGMVFPRAPEGHVQHVRERSKVVVFTCPIDISTTETKGTVLLHNAQEMLDFSAGEEQQMDAVCAEIRAAGVRVVVAGSSVGDLALHYFNKHGILVLKVPSKFDVRRVCQVCGATPLPRLGAPLPEEMGAVDVIETREIGGDRVTVFRQDAALASRTATIVLRGATQTSMDDIERAIDDGINAIKGLVKDNRLLPGAGAVEAELVKRVTQYGERTPGLMQLAIKNYAKAFEVVPRVLADTAGLDATAALSQLYAAHAPADGLGLLCGIDIDGDAENCLVDVAAAGIYDLLAAKLSAIALATEAACTILSIDQIIMAKRAGGPQMPQQRRPGNWDQED